MSKVYIKSVDDEIDWKIIDQLHTATVNFSSTSLELKKIFFVLLGIAVPSLIKLAGDKLDLSLFVTLYILSFTFWFLDSFTYFYQVSLREKMDKRFNSIKERHTENLIVLDSVKQDFTIEKERTDKNRFWRSTFNPSIMLYWIMIVFNTIALILFITKVIK